MNDVTNIWISVLDKLTVPQIVKFPALYITRGFITALTTVRHGFLSSTPNPHIFSVTYPGILFGKGGCSTNSVEDRENGDLGGGSPLVRGPGGSCNLVQEISFHIVNFS
jgi:hypothetical protein